MGLDMYAYKVAKTQDNTDLEFPDEAMVDNDFFYWRKNNALHGWMKQLFFAKGGEGSFNCQHVRLTMQDIISLEQEIKNKGLTPVEGFFFGGKEYTTYEKENDLKFVEKAKEVLEKGYFDIYYSSWW